MNPYRKGIIIAVLLAVMTIAEYIFAVEVSSAEVRFAGLTITALLKTVLILWYFMHIKRLWAAEGAH